MWDESGRYEEIVCVECGKSVEDACGHLLALLDVTFSCCEGGVACDYWEYFRTQVKEALAKYVIDGSQPRWEQYEVNELWERLRDEVDADGDFNLPGKEFVDLMACAFEEAGGVEHPGRVHSHSGGRCESRLRLIFADNPQQVCEWVVKVLEKWLVPLPSDADAKA